MDSKVLLKLIGYFSDYLSALSRTLLRSFGQPSSKQLYAILRKIFYRVPGPSEASSFRSCSFQLTGYLAPCVVLCIFLGVDHVLLSLLEMFMKREQKRLCRLCSSTENTSAA